MKRPPGRPREYLDKVKVLVSVERADLIEFDRYCEDHELTRSKALQQCISRITKRWRRNRDRE